MPYISYEGSVHQKDIATLVERTSTKSAIEDFRLKDLNFAPLGQSESMESQSVPDIDRLIEDLLSEWDGREGEEPREENEEWHEDTTHDYMTGKSSKHNTYRDNTYRNQLNGDQADGDLADGDGAGGEELEGERSNKEESDEDEADEEESYEDSAEGLTIKGYLNDRNKDGVEHLALHVRR